MHSIDDFDFTRNGIVEDSAQKVRRPSALGGVAIGREELGLQSAAAKIADWLRALLWDDQLDGKQVVELRAPNVAEYRTVTKSGFFDLDHLSDMALEALCWTGHAEG